MTFNKSNIGWLCFMWAVLILIGIAIGFNAPFVLACIGTFLYLFV